MTDRALCSPCCLFGPFSQNLLALSKKEVEKRVQQMELKKLTRAEENLKVWKGMEIYVKHVQTLNTI